VTGGGQQLTEHPQVGGRLIGRHLHRVSGVRKRPGEEPARGRQITLVAGEDVADVAMLVDCPIQQVPAIVLGICVAGWADLKDWPDASLAVCGLRWARGSDLGRCS
jgi:hypothetical protein